MKAGDLFRNRKNGFTYRVVEPRVVNCTNSQDGQEMVMYLSERKGAYPTLYVREAGEFAEKFEPVDPNLQRLRDARDRLCEQLKDRQWLKGIGISPGVHPRIWIEMADTMEATDIPDEVDGFPVGIRAVGAIRAVPDRPPRSCNVHEDCNRKPLGDPCCDDPCCEVCFGYR